MLGRTLHILESACFEPRTSPRTRSHALHHSGEIAACFGGHTTREGILGALRAGGTEWHSQAAAAVAAGSPLMGSLALESLARATHTASWKSSLQHEARLCAAATAASDFGAGASRLEKAKRELAISAVYEAEVERRLRVLRKQLRRVCAADATEVLEAESAQVASSEMEAARGAAHQGAREEANAASCAKLEAEIAIWAGDDETGETVTVEAAPVAASGEVAGPSWEHGSDKPVPSELVRSLFPN